MHHPALGMEAKFDVVDEAQPASADRMEIVFRCREDGRARHGSQESPQPAEKGGAVSRHDQRLDPVPGRCVVPAAHASGEKGAGREPSGKEIRVLRRCHEFNPASVVSHKYAYESAGPFGSAHPERSEAKSKGGCVRHSGLDRGSSSRGARHQGGDRRSPLQVIAPCRQPKCPRIFISVFVRHHASVLSG